MGKPAVVLEECPDDCPILGTCIKKQLSIAQARKVQEFIARVEKEKDATEFVLKIGRIVKRLRSKVLR